MSDNDIKKAKKLFLHYHGSFFYMDREGDFEEYKKYNIRKDQELIWIDELKQELYIGLSLDDNNSLFQLSNITLNYWDYNILDQILNYVVKNIHSGDSFTKLIYVEQIINIIESLIKYKNDCPKDILIRSNLIIMKILDNIITNPIIINPKWKHKSYLGLLNEENIMKRAKNALSKSRQLKRKYLTILELMKSNFKNVDVEDFL